MIRERVQNHGVIPRHCLITNYNAFVLINKYDASKISLYKKRLDRHMRNVTR